MPIDIEKSAHEARVKEIIDTFEYAKIIAVGAMETKKTLSMTFTLAFEDGCVPRVSYDITEVCG